MLDENLGNIHFIGIGGSGMSSLAKLYSTLVDNKITGSDVSYSTNVKTLEKYNIIFNLKQKQENIQKIDTVIYSTAIQKDNIELLTAQKKHLKILHRSEALNYLIQSKHLNATAISGSHGKTTTAGMLITALKKINCHPNFCIGGKILTFDESKENQKSNLLIFEADESDRSFLNYNFNNVLITNLDFDHVENYENFDLMKLYFLKFLKLIPKGGKLVFNIDDTIITNVIKHIRSVKKDNYFISYGFSKNANISIRSYKNISFFQTQSLIKIFSKQYNLVLKVPGKHNILNACGALAMGISLGFNIKKILYGLSQFEGISRRFELISNVNNIKIIRDYAHHPTEINEVLNTCREKIGKQHRIHVLFQPHLFSRTKKFAKYFAASLSKADTLIIIDIFGAREKYSKTVNSKLIIDEIDILKKKQNINLMKYSYISKKIYAIKKVVQLANYGDFILILGAGDIVRLGSDIVRKLKDKYSQL